MALETAPFINSLIVTNPTNTDPKSEGAAHLRLIKSAVQATFPNITGAVTPTQAELNRVTGVTSSVQGQLDAEVLARNVALSAEIQTRGNADSTETQARIYADAQLAPISSPVFTGTVTLPATGGGPTEAVRKDYADALAFAAALPNQAGNNGKVVTTNGTAANWSALKTVNNLSLVGAGNIALQASPIVRRAFLITNTSHTIPAGVGSVRVYAFGAGGTGTSGNASSGGGGGCAWGDIAVTPGDVFTITAGSGINATVVLAGVTLLTGGAASNSVRGIASKAASVTNGGANNGGSGVNVGASNAGGASSGSPGRIGVDAVAGAFGGSGWGGGGNSGNGGGASGSAVASRSGEGFSPLTIFADPLLVGLDSYGMPNLSSVASTDGFPGGPGAGGTSAASFGLLGGAGGFAGGGGWGGNGIGGNGGFGGGGGSGPTGGVGGVGGGGGSGTNAGSGGLAAVLFYY